MTSYYFIGGFFPGQLEKFIVENSKGYVQSAANNFQKNLILGLMKNIEERPGDSIDLINLPYIGSYPKLFNLKYMPRKKYEIEGYVGYTTKFNNVLFIKNYFRYIALVKELDELLSKDKDKDIKLIAYSVHTPFLMAINKIHSKYNFQTCLIVPDLPEFMNLEEKIPFLKKLFKKIDIFFSDRIVSTFDSYIFLTKYMSQRYANKPYEVIEGISTSSIAQVPNKDSNIILYTGTLDKKYGILDFIEQFLKIQDNNFKFKIYGFGDSVEKIKNYEQLYPKNIEYAGITNSENIKKEQYSARFLINPRPSKEEYTKYSFPSKLMEYLSTSTPIIATRLQGIPREYDNYINYIDDSNKENYLKSLEKILNDDYDKLKRKSFRGQNFVFEEKNAKKQTQKIIDLLNKLS